MCTACSVAVVLFHLHVHPIGILSTVGAAFGLLLVFRTNSSYDRFGKEESYWVEIEDAPG